jgi:hypothetical protein
VTVAGRHSARLANCNPPGLDPVEFSYDHALALPVCTPQYVVWMPGQGRFGGKRWMHTAKITGKPSILTE